MEKDDNGDMTTGLMCLGCGRITQASTMLWSWCYRPRVKKVPVVHLMCPECSFINPVNINYMKIDKENHKAKEK